MADIGNNIFTRLKKLFKKVNNGQEPKGNNIEEVIDSATQDYTPGGGGGGGEPAEYLKSVVKDDSAKTATFTDKEGNETEIPYGGGGYKIDLGEIHDLEPTIELTDEQWSKIVEDPSAVTIEALISPELNVSLKYQCYTDFLYRYSCQYVDESQPTKTVLALVADDHGQKLAKLYLIENGNGPNNETIELSSKGKFRVKDGSLNIGHFTEDTAQILNEKLDSSHITHETLTFTLTDGTVVTKEMAIWVD